MNPALVDGTANIPDAARKLVWGATAWGGQWCTSPGYAYVHESIAEAFIAEAKAALLELYGKDPKANPDYSRMIGANDVARLAALIDPAGGVRSLFSFGGASQDRPRRIHVDRDGAIRVCGIFRGEAEFAGRKLRANGMWNGFLVELRPATTADPERP